MTRTKIQKTIAIVLAMCVAFALMSVTMLQNVNAAALDDGVAYEIKTPTTTAKADTNNWEIIAEAENAPTLTVLVTFENNNSKFIVKSDDGTADAKTTEANLSKAMKVYSDEALTKEMNVTIPVQNLNGVANGEMQFQVPLNELTAFEKGATYYVVLDKSIFATDKYDGANVVVEFSLKNTNTASTTTTTTTTTTRRVTTSTTNRTVSTVKTATTKRANAANTSDPGHLPMWVAFVILAGGAFGIAHVWNKNEE